jgi:hypothetical protein
MSSSLVAQSTIHCGRRQALTRRNTGRWVDPEPLRITVTATAKVVNTSERVVLDTEGSERTFNPGVLHLVKSPGQKLRAMGVGDDVGDPPVHAAGLAVPHCPQFVSSPTSTRSRPCAPQTCSRDKQPVDCRGPCHEVVVVALRRGGQDQTCRRKGMTPLFSAAGGTAARALSVLTSSTSGC